MVHMSGDQGRSKARAGQCLQPQKQGRRVRAAGEGDDDVVLGGRRSLAAKELAEQGWQV
jgi:hypothetical protein